MLISTIRTLLAGGRLNIVSVLMQIAAVLFVIFCILPLHEYAHGLVAYKLGDPTAKNSGRLTLNPLASIDPIGALLILLFGFGYAKPVPVNPWFFKRPKLGMALVAFAGPFANILAAIVGGIVYNLIVAIFGTMPFLLYVFLYYYIVINVSLAAFNLLPIPPLDGSKILAAVLPNSVVSKMYRYQQFFMIGLMMLLFTGILDIPLNYLRDAVYSFAMWIADLPFKLFGLV